VYWPPSSMQVTEPPRYNVADTSAAMAAGEDEQSRFLAELDTARRSGDRPAA